MRGVALGSSVKIGRIVGSCEGEPLLAKSRAMNFDVRGLVMEMG